jgi:hypothetical protein
MDWRYTMRKLTNGSTTLNITEHIILKNFWEYYVTDDDTGCEGIFQALVMGDELELGDVSEDEIKPYIITRTKDLNIMPAQGWRWVEDGNAEQ